ncbi:MAG: DNA-3-methyladenine glycosylase 2 family protein [Propionibacteriaceae bacterium]|nr:DNA-3-methyladenine glycosylase 2 family protein [Micropruina sp.]HBX81588.1 3-methyladenine DNA glycosylase [Propionibacteriaceae bacterium]
MQRHRDWRPDWPCPVGQVWSTWHKGSGDPTYRLTGGRHWRAFRTPLGTATMAVTPLDTFGIIAADAWGDGAEWVLDRLPAMLGADDDLAGFEAQHPVVRAAQHDHPHWRFGRGGLVWHALVPAVLEQKVTGQQAFAGYRMLVRRYGEPAPGPLPDLWVPPGPAEVKAVPSWEWLKMQVDPARSRTLIQAASRASGIERTLTLDEPAADTALQSLPGIGVWTSAEIRHRAHGHADAVSFGDFHVAHNVGWALLGRRIDDAEMAELLEPWRPHRGRVVRLLELQAVGAPRHGPRMAAPKHLPR